MTKNQGEESEPAIIVIFGITGDLSQRYLLPSLYHLIKDKLLHPQTKILGVTRQGISTEELFSKVELCINEVDNICDPEVLADMSARTEMFRMDLTSADSYDALLKKLNDTEQATGICMNRLYYLSIPPNTYGPIVRLLGERGLNTTCQHGKAASRLLVEKPFGFDLHSAKELIEETNKYFREDQIFRIDHYMAKETVQNILTFRFENPIFEALWSNKHITAIDIIAKEKIGIEGRATFYEPLGALRDFIQSHLIQILGIITMDKPEHPKSDEIHALKLAALEQIETVPADKLSERAKRGQYEGYRQEVNKPDSFTETYAEVTVYSTSPRWQGVPIRMLTGKGMDERKTEVAITFNDSEGESNILRFRIQPNEGIELDLQTKKPGFQYQTQKTAMDFSYKNNFNDSGHPNAYERVLADATRGDHTLFATSEEVLAGWRILQPVVEAWSHGPEGLISYPLGARQVGAVRE